MARLEEKEQPEGVGATGPCEQGAPDMPVSVISKKEGSSPESCSVRMFGGKLCGRPTWGPMINDTRYCLMHIPSGKGDAAFQSEIERILKTAGHGLADFTRFVFPSANYKHKLFEAECIFAGAEFHKRTEFTGATFAHGADFHGVSFMGTADFAGVTFNRGGTFVAATQQNSAPEAGSELSYGHFSEFVKNYPGRKWVGRCAFFGHSLMTALSVAGFQKELKYEPSYPWGRVLALLELLLTSTLIALFLLAVRRQFRR